MNDLYPLKFAPIFKDKIWGGQKAQTSLGLDFSPLTRCGEVWALSAVPGNISVVTNGFLEGNELNELIEVYMSDLVGEKVYDQFENKFPLLIKFIDANDWLSIQVHPGNELARERHKSNGKTEMWYVVEASSNAEVISGFGKSISKDEYIERLNNKTLKNVLNFEKVQAGDVFYMPAGRIHAMGPGILIAEIQQSSDITYRIYDWDRVDEEGKSRQLHIEEALDAIDFSVPNNYKNDYPKKQNQTVNLVESPYFVTNLVNFTLPVTKVYDEIDSFVIYLCVEGGCKVDYPTGSEILKTGEAILIPAEINNLTLIPDRSTKLLEVYVP